MTFKKAVSEIIELKDAYENGLQALGAHSVKIQPRRTRDCSGSVDLDSAMKKNRPKEARWDYVLGYLEKAYFVEVHSASGEVSKLIQKVTWLRNWLKTEGVTLSNIHHKDKNFHWIPTNGVNIMGKQRILLAQNKLVITSRLQLPQ